MWRAHDGMGWWMVFGMLLWFVFWASVVYLVVTPVSRRGTDSWRGSDDDALDIARRRYASGEISRDEFRRIADDLRGHSGAMR